MILSLQKQVANLTEHLKENAYKMEGIESMNIDLLIKNRNSNEELQRILKELLDVILNLQKQVANLNEQLKENANKMEGIESMNTDIFIKERNNNEEFQKHID
jgi:sulfur transfer protein SufE